MVIDPKRPHAVTFESYFYSTGCYAVLQFLESPRALSRERPERSSKTWDKGSSETRDLRDEENTKRMYRGELSVIRPYTGCKRRNTRKDV